MDIRLTGTTIGKEFNRRTIFRNISFFLVGGESLLISGRNGSGKSTLVKIIAEVLSPSAGMVSLTIDGTLRTSDRCRFVGFVSPYLQLYEEFSAREMLSLSLALRGLPGDRRRTDDLLEFVGLSGRGNDFIRTFSSGMKQRVKYAMALLHRPPVLILDEPMANLDADGIATVRTLMAQHLTGGSLVVATNDRSDIPNFSRLVDLNADH